MSMIYETAILLRPDHKEGAIDQVKTTLSSVLSENDGEIMLEDNWGVKNFAWPLKKGVTRGHYLYFVFKSGPNANKEIERRFNINEDVIRTLIVKMGPEKKAAPLLKEYTNPFDGR